MAQGNVDVVRRAFEAWFESGAEAAKQLWAEDIELHDPPSLPDRRVVRGRDPVADYLADQLRLVVGERKLALIDVRTRGEAVALRMEMTIHGAGSGVEIPGEMAQVVEVAGGRLQRIRLFMTWEEALEAAGLEE